MPPKRSVSIHAPTRGATYIDIGTDKTITQFQFTHPRGVRQNVKNVKNGKNGFNSRTHAGCDFNLIHNSL